MAHDLRSPLAVIKDLISSQSLSSHRELKLLKRTVLRIECIANDLLMRYRGERKKIGLCDLHRTLTEILAEWNYIFAQHPHVSFESQIDSEVRDVLVEVNASDLSRIISNLLLNALEALPKNRKGEVSLRAIKLDHIVRIEIADNGVGFDSQQLKPQGLGLGITQAVDLLKRARGKIEMKSRNPMGAVVVLEIPDIKEAGTVLKKPVSADLILIDDDPLVRMSWTLLANKKELRLLALSDPRELKKYSLAEDIPIFVDAHLSNGLDGIDVAHDLHRSGFQNLSITTGDLSLGHLRRHWIKEVRGKEFPSLI